MKSDAQVQQLLSLPMLAGYSESDGSEDDDFLPVECGSRCIWQSGDRRLSVAHAWAEAPPNLQGLLGAVAADTLSNTPPEPHCACVVEKMLRLAFTVNQPQQYCPEPPRKRRRGKQGPALGTLLARSMRAPTTDVASHFDWKDRRKGYHEFERRYALDMQTSVRTVRDRAQHIWNTASRAVQHGWSILAKVTEQMYDRQGRVRKLLPPPGHDDASPPPDEAIQQPADTRTCHGVLCTWMLELGLHDADVLALLAEGHRGEALRSRLVALPLYQQAFDGFSAFVVARAREYGFRSEAASMELCMNGALPHRVHVHAFLGPQIAFVDWGQWNRSKELSEGDLYWGGTIPHLQLRVAHPNPRGFCQETIRGLYYALMEKPGTMFRAGNRWPFQEVKCHAFCPIRFL